jgi:GNAT superfamily N-acetyltransferase
MEYRIRPLERSDNRKEFESGQADLDHFFKRYAGQNQFRHHIGVTYIATNGSSIFGYVTVAMGVIEAEGLSEKKGLPGSYALPILRLGRLAVVNRYQAQGIGKQLLRYLLRFALEQKDTVGCVGVVVDAKPEAVEFYRKFGFTVIDDPVEGRMRGNPPPKPFFLPINSISVPS